MFAENRMVKPAVVHAVARIVRAGYFRQTFEVQTTVLNALAIELSAAYEIPVPNVVTFPDGGRGGTYHSTDRALVVVGHPLSIVTFLHEFRHHVQECRRDPAVPVTEGAMRRREYNAQYWALAAFEKACPRSFAAALAANRLLLPEGFTIPGSN